MKKITLPLAFMLLMAAGQTEAAPRTKAQMRQAAQTALRSKSLNLQAPKKNTALRELKHTPAFSIFGYEEGGFAVISADDLAPEVLGMSSKRYNEANTNFQWWQKAMSQAVETAVSSGRMMKIVAPDPDKYPTQVGPLMTTEWDQLEPYNRLCPISNGGDRCYTGCVATAMAQVMNYFKVPEHGIGNRTIYYPQNDTSGQAVTATFGDDYYDWDNMLNKYTSGYSDEEAQAVALLMRDCGVAADMQYGGSAENGSGAYSQDAAEGLRNYFGFEDATCYERDNYYGTNYYTDEEWMDMVFTALSEDGPIYYGGSDPDPWGGGGHAFVLHGYNEEGLVYVNWGWSGDDDGYYDISLLNPSYYEFKVGQDMIIGVRGERRELHAKDVVLEEAGFLKDQFEEEEFGYVGSLKVSGTINSDDLRYLRELGGSDAECNRTDGRLESLDLSEARFVEGGDPYITLNNANLVTANDILPERAFYGCKRLKSIKLPQGIKEFGKGAFALCSQLTEIELTPAEDATFILDGNLVWQGEQTEEVEPEDPETPDEKESEDPDEKDSEESNDEDPTGETPEEPEPTEPEEPAAFEPTELLAVLPMQSHDLTLPSTTTTISDYALAGCAKLTKVVIPASITTIGREALRNCSSLREIRVGGKEIPTLAGADVFEGISYSNCKLYVRSGMKTKFSKAAQWRAFADNGDNIYEYGTTIKARNTVRDYGDENPVLGYQIKGDHVTGTPVITCEADRYSPAGRYTIHIEPGTITDEAVDFEDGYLVVKRADLTVMVKDTTRQQFQENPEEYEFEFEGFRNDDDASMLDELPLVVTDATPESEVGEYILRLEGGSDDCYAYKLVDGKLTVTEYVEPPIPTAISSVSSQSATAGDVYDLQGRRVASQLKGLPAGIYMVNGRKVIIR